MKRSHASIWIIIGWIGLSLAFQNCSTKKSKDEASPRELSSEDASILNNMKIYCQSCHNPLAPSHDALIAPPMAAVKFRYKRQYRSKEEFVEGMTGFLMNPTQESALMRMAAQNFGVMTLTPLTETETRKIASFIYDNELEKPTWFAKHFEEEHGMKWRE